MVFRPAMEIIIIISRVCMPGSLFQHMLCSDVLLLKYILLCQYWGGVVSGVLLSAN